MSTGITLQGGTDRLSRIWEIPLLLDGVQGDRRATGPFRVAAAAQQTAQGVLVGRLYLEYARSGVFERDERRAADPAGLFLIGPRALQRDHHVRHAPILTGRPLNVRTIGQGRYGDGYRSRGAEVKLPSPVSSALTR